MRHKKMNTITKKMKYPLLLILIVFTSCFGSKNSSSNKLSKLSHKFTKFENFELREKPILNREYVIFLCWYIDVYGYSYPEKIIEIIPENSLNSIPDYIDEFETLFSSINPNSILKTYILNPEFLNYPLVGLSEFQVMELQNWLYHRYNESTLIKNNYLNYTMQKDEDCFTTESLLVDQYIGDVKTKYTPDWNKNKFKSTFRLPYSDELNIASKRNELNNNLIEYPFSSSDFLWLWNQQYISSNAKEGILSLNLDGSEIPISNFNRSEKLLKQVYSNAFFTKKENEPTNIKYFESKDSEPYPYREKGFDGRMNFVVIGTNDKLQPIIADRFIGNKNNKMEHKIFRIASTLKVEKEYWPK